MCGANAFCLQGWIGGWLLPQEASYFALALPHGWWLFGLDLALVDDIDMCQTRCTWSAAEASLHMGMWTAMHSALRHQLFCNRASPRVTV